jgi:hypothetical protein
MPLEPRMAWETIDEVKAQLGDSKTRAWPTSTTTMTA